MTNERDQTEIGKVIDPPYFFGVFDEFQPIQNHGFSSLPYVDHCTNLIEMWAGSKKAPFNPRNELKRIVKRILGWRTLPRNFVIPHQYISGKLEKNETLNILDIGGGVGDNYFRIRRALGFNSHGFDWDVVDNETQCNFGENYFREDDSVHFHTGIPDADYDLVLIIGTLQYIENWKDVVKTLSKMRKARVYISRTPLQTSNSSFVSVQSIVPSTLMIKVGEENLWVINERELVEEFAAAGFSVSESSKPTDYSENFLRLPEEYQAAYYKDLMFKST